jgi:protein kinase A
MSCPSVPVTDLRIDHSVCLGTGKFGVVRTCTWANSGDQVYALKCIDRAKVSSGQRSIRNIFSEKEALIAFEKSPFIITLFGTSKDERSLYFLMELVNGKPLYVHSRRGVFRSNMEVTSYISSQVLCALEFIHKSGYIYRDLKGSNVLVQCDGFIKLIDFGFCKQTSGRCFTFCGTLHAMAPEILGQQLSSGNNGYGRWVDFWAFGVLLYEMCLGEPPCTSTSPEEMLKQTSEGYNFRSLQDAICRRHNADTVTPLQSALWLQCSHLLRKLWQPQLSDRLGYAGVQSIKDDPFFGNISWEALENGKHHGDIIADCRTVLLDNKS